MSVPGKENPPTALSAEHCRWSGTTENMAHIPELELKRAEIALQRFCDRVPPHVRDQLSYHWRVRGKQITLFEKRPAFMRPGKYVDIPTARFQFNPRRHAWLLKWPNRNGRFHIYEGFESVGDVTELVAEVERDPTGIFLG